MLKSMRDGAKSGFMKFILLGFMAMAVGGLVLTDVGGFFRGGISTNIVAKGKNIEISTAEFDRSVRRILSRQSMSAQDAYSYGMIHQILQNEIQNRIITQEAHKMGIRIDDEAVTKQISKLAEPLTAGSASKADAIKQILRSQGISEGEFIAALRQEMGNTLFRNALVQEKAAISMKQAEDLYLYKNETREFDAIVLRAKDISDVAQPTDMQLEKFYDTNKAEFMISEKRSITVATLTKESLAGKVTITDDELREIYEDRITSYQDPEKRKLLQAVFSTQKEAQDAVTKVESGSSLEKAAADSAGGASSYLGESAVQQNGLPDDIAKPVFSAKKGDIIGPVETALGWHVLILQDVLAPKTESFANVKNSIRDNLLQTRLMGDLEDASMTLEDRLGAGEDLAIVAKDMGLKTQSYKNFNLAGFAEDRKDILSGFKGDKATIIETAFDFDEGESSPVMQLENGDFITVHIDKVQEHEFTPFESVKAKLKARWINQQRAAMNNARASDALAMLQKGNSLNDVAKEYGVRVTPFKNLTRSGKAADPLNAQSINRIFTTDKGEGLSLPVEDTFVIGEVTSIDLPDASNKEKEIKQIKQDVSDSLAQESLVQYVSALSEKYKVKINDRVLQSLYGSPDGQ